MKTNYGIKKTGNRFYVHSLNVAGIDYENGKWQWSDKVGAYFTTVKSEAVRAGYVDISSAASVLGSIKSDKKTASSRENGKLGGRPKLGKTLIEIRKMVEEKQQEYRKISGINCGVISGAIDTNDLQTEITDLQAEYNHRSKRDMFYGGVIVKR